MKKCEECRKVVKDLKWAKIQQGYRIISYLVTELVAKSVSFLCVHQILLTVVQLGLGQLVNLKHSWSISCELVFPDNVQSEYEKHIHFLTVNQLLHTCKGQVKVLSLNAMANLRLLIDKRKQKTCQLPSHIDVIAGKFLFLL